MRPPSSPFRCLLLLACLLLLSQPLLSHAGSSPATSSAIELAREKAAALLSEAQRLFPDEWQDLPLSEEYRFEREIPNHATARTIWVSESGLEAQKITKRAWAHLLKRGDPLPPNTLMLNMLTRDESENLERTLPLWAKVVDYWIIGVDDANTDDSVEVIKKHLGHLPGEIMEVHFDGMGPTWGKLAERGVRAYKGVTHQIGVDADYSPVLTSFDRRKLNLKCSVHYFQINFPRVSSQRTSNWIFRSIPGATFIHRVHHLVRVPGLPGGHGEECRVDFPVHEEGGGYGDKSGMGAKQLRYIKALELDIVDYPEDALPFYYLAHAHLDYFDTLPNKTTSVALGHLAAALETFQQRWNLTHGHPEERFWAQIKIGEIHQRLTGNLTASLEAYHVARRYDVSRGEGWLGIGEVMVRMGNYSGAQPYLRKMATLKQPLHKDYFMWNNLYRCVAKFMYAQFMYEWESAPVDVLKDAYELLQRAKCLGDEPSTRTPQQQADLSKRLRERITNLEKAWDGQPQGDKGTEEDEEIEEAPRRRDTPRRRRAADDDSSLDAPPRRRRSRRRSRHAKYADVPRRRSRTRAPRRRYEEEENEEEYDQPPRKQRPSPATDADRPRPASPQPKKPSSPPLGHYTPSECLQTIRAWKEVASRVRFVEEITRVPTVVRSPKRLIQLTPLRRLSEAITTAVTLSEQMLEVNRDLAVFLAKAAEKPVEQITCKTVRGLTAQYLQLLAPNHLAFLAVGDREKFSEAIRGAYALCRFAYFKDAV